MGTTTSTLSNTLTELKRFDVFPVFLTNRSEADKLITTKATHALKNVNSSFLSPLNGHLKQKHILALPLSFRVSPVWCLQRLAESNIPVASIPMPCLLSSIIPLSPESSTLATETSLLCSLLSYCVLLPNDLFRISDGDNFNKSIGGYLDNNQLLLHSRIQKGCTKYEVLMNVVVLVFVINVSQTQYISNIDYIDSTKVTCHCCIVRNAPVCAIIWGWKMYLVVKYSCLKNVPIYCSSQFLKLLEKDRTRVCMDLFTTPFLIWLTGITNKHYTC